MKISEVEGIPSDSLERIVNYGMMSITGIPDENPNDLLYTQEKPPNNPDYRFTVPLLGLMEKEVISSDEETEETNFRPISTEEVDKEDNPVRVFEISGATEEFLGAQLSEQIDQYVKQFGPYMLPDEEREELFPVVDGGQMMTEEGAKFLNVIGSAMITGIMQQLPDSMYYTHPETGFKIPNLKGRMSFYFNTEIRNGGFAIDDISLKEKIFHPDLMVPLLARTADLDELEDLDPDQCDSRIETIAERWASMAIIDATLHNNPNVFDLYKPISELPREMLSEEPERFLELFLTDKGYEILCGEDGKSGARGKVQTAIVKEFERLQDEEEVFDYMLIEWDEAENPYITTSRMYIEPEKMGVVASSSKKKFTEIEGLEDFVRDSALALKKQVMKKEVGWDAKSEATLKLALQNYLRNAMPGAMNYGTEGKGIMTAAIYQTDPVGQIIFAPYNPLQENIQEESDGAE